MPSAARRHARHRGHPPRAVPRRSTSPTSPAAGSTPSGSSGSPVGHGRRHLLVREAGGIVTTSRASHVRSPRPLSSAAIPPCTPGFSTRSRHTMKLVECVPNFSEGRRPEVVDAIRDAIAAVAGRARPRRQRRREPQPRASSPSSRRSRRAVDAAFRGHPRSRTTTSTSRPTPASIRAWAPPTSCPFIPLEGSTMEDCIALARSLGERVGRELGHPGVPLRARRDAPRSREPRRRPPRRVRGAARRDRHARRSARPTSGRRRCTPTAGAVAIGARPFLVAYNVYLGPADQPARRQGGREGGARLRRAGCAT